MVNMTFLPGMISGSGHATSLKQAHYLHQIGITPNMTFRSNTVMHYTEHLRAAVLVCQYALFATFNVIKFYILLPYWPENKTQP